MEKTRFNVIHLSDLHFGNPKVNKIKQDDSFRKLVNKIYSLHELNTIDYIIISGDIGYTGKKEDYLEDEKIDKICTAGNFIKFLNQKFNRSHFPKIIVCPGNHDLFDGTFNGRVDEKKAFEFEDKYLKKFSADSLKIDHHLVSKFRWYNKFCETYKERIIKPQTKDASSSYLYGYSYFEQIKTAFVVINSAWLATPNRKSNQGHLYVNKRIVENIYFEVKEKNPEIVITIMHHPPYWLNWSERFDTTNRKSPIMQTIVNNSEFILAGHEHCNILPPDNLLSNSLFFITGATFEKPLKEEDSYLNAFHMLEINIIDKTLVQRIFEFKNDYYGMLDWQEFPLKENKFHFASHKKLRQEYSSTSNVIQNKNREEIFSNISKKHIDLGIIYREFSTFANIDEMTSLIKSHLTQNKHGKIFVSFDLQDKETFSNLELEFKKDIQANKCVLFYV